MLSFLVAHIIPVVNYIRYSRFKGKIVNSAKVELGVHGADTKNKEGKTTSAKETDKRLAFAKDKSFDQWEMNDLQALLGVREALKKQEAEVKNERDPQIIERAKEELTEKIAAMERAKEELTDKIAAMDSVTNVYGLLNPKQTKADESGKAAAATIVNKAYQPDQPYGSSEPTPPKPDPSKLWRMTKDEPKKPHLECGPTHE